MERRQVITSLCALLGIGRPSSTAAALRRPISKNSTRCEVSEYAVGQRHALPSPEPLPRRAPSIEPTQTSASAQE